MVSKVFSFIFHSFNESSFTPYFILATVLDIGNMILVLIKVTFNEKERTQSSIFLWSIYITVCLDEIQGMMKRTEKLSG